MEDLIGFLLFLMSFVFQQNKDNKRSEDRKSISLRDKKIPVLQLPIPQPKN